MASGKPEGAFIQRVLTEGDRPTYSVVASDYTPAATATDMLLIPASATKLVRITHVNVSGDQTTGSTTVDIYLFKRTASNTGGSSTAPAVVKHDSQDPTPSVAPVLYSANPAALGAGVLLRGDHIILPPSSSANAGTAMIEYYFGNRAAKCPILRPGTQEAFVINWGGNAVPTGTNLYLNIEWTEEDLQ